jgi:hypothetical protein
LSFGRVRDPATAGQPSNRLGLPETIGLLLMLSYGRAGTSICRASCSLVRIWRLFEKNAQLSIARRTAAPTSEAVAQVRRTVVMVAGWWIRLACKR